MPAIRSLLKSGASSTWGPLVCVGVKAVVQVPAEQAVGWLRERFADHSQALPQAIVAANDGRGRPSNSRSPRTASGGDCSAASATAT